MQYICNYRDATTCVTNLRTLLQFVSYSDPNLVIHACLYVFLFQCLGKRERAHLVLQLAPYPAYKPRTTRVGHFRARTEDYLRNAQTNKYHQVW